MKKKLRKLKCKNFLIEKKGFVLNMKNRGECAKYEDSCCLGSFEIGGFSDSHYIYNFKFIAKSKDYIISADDINNIKNNIFNKLNITMTPNYDMKGIYAA